MIRYVLFEDAAVDNFYPLVYWRTVFELWCGRYTLAERLSRVFGAKPVGFWTREFIADVAADRFERAVNAPIEPGTILLNGRLLPKTSFEIAPPPAVGINGRTIVYIACDEKLSAKLKPELVRRTDVTIDAPVVEVDCPLVEYPWTLVHKNYDMLVADFSPDDHFNEGDLSAGAIVINQHHLHVGKAAIVKPTAVLDAAHGPIYIDDGATVYPHTYIQGPAYIGPGTVVNPFTQIRDGCTIGPVCKVGGEIDATIIQGFTNKQHDGFLGHSYVGSWVNLGAGCTNSDLKNTYGSVTVPICGKPVDSGEKFVGAFIGDHAKIGINQTIPTGASIGFAANAAAGYVLPKFTPSFAWLTDEGTGRADPERLLAVARTVMGRRKVEMTPSEQQLFAAIPDIAASIEKPD